MAERRETAQLRLRRDAEVRQAPGRDSALFHTAHAGQLVKQLGHAVRLDDGSVRVPLAPRGWVDADVLEEVKTPLPATSPVAATATPARQAPAAAQEAAPPAPRPEAPPAPREAAPPASGEAAPPASRGGRRFRVRWETEVRQAASRSSMLCHAVQAGRVVEQLGPVATLEDGSRRVPLLPRGWVDEEALEPLDGEAEAPSGRQAPAAAAAAQPAAAAAPAAPAAAPAAAADGGRDLLALLGDDRGRRGPAAGGGRAEEVEEAAAAAAPPPPQPAPGAAAGGGGDLAALLGDGRRLGRQRQQQQEQQQQEEEPPPAQAQPQPEPWPRGLDWSSHGHDEWKASPSAAVSYYSSGADTHSHVQGDWQAFPGSAEGGLTAGTGGSASLGSDASREPGARPSWISRLDEELAEHLQPDAREAVRLEDAKRVEAAVDEVLRKLEAGGVAKVFGSFSNGFQTASSDLDLAFSGEAAPADGLGLLSRLAERLPEHGFEGVTKIFQASIPLVKFSDAKSGMEVDFCVSNELGLRNSLLLNAYCRYDPRVVQLGRLVKDWAKSHELVGTADGCLNSYAYVLMTIHYLQSMDVVPNLQVIATGSVPVWDSKWGTADRWETKFHEDVASLPVSECRRSVGELLLGFFRYYGSSFAWGSHAVCPRLNRPCAAVDKFSLAIPTSEEQWYVEDPFDLRHNLARNCTAEARARILQAFQQAAQVLSDPSAGGGAWARARGAGTEDRYFLKFRVGPSVDPEALVKAFKDLELAKLWFPERGEGNRQAFLEFKTAAARRRAHTRNESYVQDLQLQLLYCSRHSLAEALAHGELQAHEAPASSAA